MPPQYVGLIRLRQGSGQSKNVVMARVMRTMGVDHAAEYLQRFSFPTQNVVHVESLVLGSTSFTSLQAARGYLAMINGDFLANPFSISKIENDQGGILFEERPKIACLQCDLPIVYGDTPKSNVLKNKNVEDATTSTEPQNSNVPPRPQLKQVNQSLVTQNSAQEYALHMTSTSLSFLIRSTLNSNIFGKPGWIGTGWRAGHDLQRHDIDGRTGTTNSSKDAWFSDYGPGVVTSVWTGLDDHHRNPGRTTASGVIKDQISGYERGAKSTQPTWNSFMKSVLEGAPEEPLTPSPGTATVDIDRSTDQSVNGDSSRVEYFIEGTQPTQQTVYEMGVTPIDGGGETRELSRQKKRLRASSYCH